MNFFRNFESRVSDAFGSSPRGHAAPFSFRKLAKAVARELEAETYIVDGVDTAPALYTVLVSSSDDSSMRLLYPQLTSEVVELVAAQADKRGYAFVGRPLARFMSVPHLRSGKFEVFAENVDAATLDQLRAEERAFLAGSSSVGGAAADRRSSPARRRPTRRPEVVPMDSEPSSEGDLLPVTPSSMPAAAPVASPSQVSPVGPDDSSSIGLDVVPEDFDLMGGQVGGMRLSVPEVPAGKSVPSVEVPVTQRRPTPVSNPLDSALAELKAERAQEEKPATCTLTDHATRTSYMATEPTCAIGRERVAGGIVLRDPNVSRRHAELSFDGIAWRLNDLNSTNGTLVNGTEVASCVLRDGDRITVGLTTLEFRED